MPSFLSTLSNKRTFISSTPINVGPIVPTPTLSGIALRGYTLTVTGLSGGTLQFQQRSSSQGAWTDVSLTNPVVLGSAHVGKEYRAKVTDGGVSYFSAPFGPIGISDTVTPQNNAYHSIGQNVALVNTDGVGFNSGYLRGVDYAETISYFADDFGSNARMSWMLNPGVGGTAGRIFAYMYIARNRYVDGSAASAYSSGVAQSELSSQAFTWDLTEEFGGDANRSYLIEYFPSNSPTSVTEATAGVGGNRQSELGILPIVSNIIRTYFTSAPVITYPDYVDENGLSWLVRSKAPPQQVLASGRYIVAIPPSGVTYLEGSIRHDRYLNWLISQDATKGQHYMTGLGAGLEINTETAGGEGVIEGKFFPSEAEWPWSGMFASPYTFDSDVSAYFARFSNLPGIEVRKAVDAFIAGLKTSGFYGLIDDMYLFRAAGKVDMRRAFKSASHDLVDRAGTASYVAKQGLTYAGAGYGGTQFNPATAGGQFQQDSAHMFWFIESDPGVVGTPHLGNAGAQARRFGNNGSITRFNNSADFNGGNYVYPQGYLLRRAAGALQEGTGGSANYQVRRTGSTSTFGDPSPAKVSETLVNGELEVGRAGSGTTYSQAVFSMMSYGGGMTLTQATQYHNLALTLRDALDAAGV